MKCQMTSVHIVLLEAPYDSEKELNNSALLTIDLTKAVADEAIERGDSIIIAYREIHCVLSEILQFRSSELNPRYQIQ